MWLAPLRRDRRAVPGGSAACFAYGSPMFLRRASRPPFYRFSDFVENRISACSCPAQCGAKCHWESPDPDQEKLNSRLLAPTCIKREPFGENVQGRDLLATSDLRGSGPPVLSVQQPFVLE